MSSRRCDLWQRKKSTEVNEGNEGVLGRALHLPKEFRNPERFRGCPTKCSRLFASFVGKHQSLLPSVKIFSDSISELNSPSLTRVRIFIFGRTAAIVRMIFPRSVKRLFGMSTQEVIAELSRSD